jgi:nitroreductase
MKRFQRNYSGALQIGFEHRLSRITALYHVLEKGLSFEDSRPFFGKDKVTLLVSDLTEYIGERGDPSAVQWQSAVKVLNAYLETNASVEAGSEESTFLKSLQTDLHLLNQHLISEDVGGGVIECSRDDIQSRAKLGFPDMALSRYSVRHFDGRPVAKEVVEKAMVWAQKSPSVCNRQGSRVHAVKGQNKISEILDIHGGTRGFTEKIDTLLLVTGDLRIFLGPVERNQVYLDAGIFSMSILYGLHYQGVGACALHWCVIPEKDLALRRLVNIPDEETITALIAVGSLPETFKVAHSQRRLPDDVLFWK